MAGSRWKLTDDWMSVEKYFEADSAIILLIVMRAGWLNEGEVEEA